MNKTVEDSGEDQFANGQSSRDLRVRSDAGELEIQLTEAIDNVGDFLHFVEISTRGIAVKYQRRLF